MPESRDLLSLAQCAELLGLTRGRLRGHRAALEEIAAGRDRWRRPLFKRGDFYRWAADNLPAGFAPLIPLQYWGRPGKPATFLTAMQLTGGSGVAQLWRTERGTVVLAWDYPSDKEKTLTAAIGEGYNAAAVAVVGGDFGRGGPAVWAKLPGRPAAPVHEPGWRALSNALGRPVPFWPFPLRIPELILRWKPGMPQTVAAARVVLDADAPLRVAALADQGSPVQKTMTNLVRTWQWRATESANTDVRIAGEWGTPETLVLAAVPLPVPETEIADLEESTRRAGWLEILGRKDHLAALCVRRQLEWDGGRAFPTGQSEEVDLATPHGREWAGRLAAADRTACVEALDPKQEAAEVLTDPETDAPVVRLADGTLLTASPGRLPTTSPLAEVILDHPVWVRTDDGTLYVAPQDSYWGISWGYNGSGPGSLALLIHRLLDDITAPAADANGGAPDGLETLTQMKWPPGTVFTRVQLEDARRGILPAPPARQADE